MLFNTRDDGGSGISELARATDVHDSGQFGVYRLPRGEWTEREIQSRDTLGLDNGVDGAVDG